MKKTLVVIVGATLICISVADFTQVLQTEGPGPDEDWPHAEKAQHEDLDAKLLSLAGKGAVFCGHVALEQDPKAANGCALKAFTKNRAFYVGYDVPVEDFYVSEGVARDARGRMYAVEFDSRDMPSEGYSPWSQVSDNSHVYTRPCPT